MDKVVYIILIVFLLTILSLISAILLSLFGGNQNALLIETVTTTWKMGFGALIGLLGGRNLSK